jgi:hypothetical protein
VNAPKLNSGVVPELNLRFKIRMHRQMRVQTRPTGPARKSECRNSGSKCSAFAEPYRPPSDLDPAHSRTRCIFLDHNYAQEKESESYS